MPGRGRPFQKGQSGNPTGRPKSDRTVMELARIYGPRAIEVLAEVMNDPKATATARAMAADRILDRAYGRAPQAIGLSVGGVGARPIADYSDEELSAIIATAQAAPLKQRAKTSSCRPIPRR